MRLGFHGAAGTVTGSRYIVEDQGECVLVDCGMFQGLKQLRLRNRAPFPVDPASIQAVILTHAHIDHTGYLPLLVKHGFRGKVFCTRPTADLCRLLLPDSGHVQEMEARHANKRGYSRHNPSLPLYTRAEAEACLPQLTAVAFHESLTVGRFVFRFQRSGHILGASSVTVRSGGTSILFSGDIGRWDDPILHAPEARPGSDFVVIESTYGGRVHAPDNARDSMAAVISRTVARNGVVVMPAFAVGRAQLLLYHLRALLDAGRIPRVPIYLDSPLAAAVTRLVPNHRPELKLSDAEIRGLLDVCTITESSEESKRIDQSSGPMIIISASGMATGGRVLFHLDAFAPDARNTIMISGFQAAGTRGASLAAGASHVRIFGRDVPIRAEVVVQPGLSAHADSNGLIAWLRSGEQVPRHTFVTHGEPVESDALRLRIQNELLWDVSVPEHGQVTHLAAAIPSPQRMVSS